MKLIIPDINPEKQQQADAAVTIVKNYRKICDLQTNVGDIAAAADTKQRLERYVSISRKIPHGS